MSKRFKKYILLLIFFASGFSSLVYQVAWQRILTLYYSVENISTTLIVSVYMLGLGLGAIFGGRIAEKTENKIRLYLLIELAIGAFGCISLPFLELLGRYTAGVGHGVAFICMFAFLCIPTMLMGMTLPLLTKIFNSLAHNFLQSLSFLYFINTLGAALGALITSYIFISFWGLDISIFIAAAVNIFIATLLFVFRKPLGVAEAPARDEAPDPTVSQSTGVDKGLSENLIFLIVFCTGFIAIGYEIIWFRMIGTIVKASPYSFSTVLAIYLMGIALGSYFMKRFLGGSKRTRSINRRDLFFSLQVVIALYVLFSVSAYHYLVNHVEYIRKLNFRSFNNLFHPTIEPPPNYRIGSLVMWVINRIDIVVWPSIFILVPTLIMGASFPLVTSLAYKTDREADTVGRIYFFNVLGNVTGGLLAGLFLLGAIGTEHSLLLLSFMGLLFIFFNGKGLYIKGMVGKGIAVVAIIVISLLVFPGKTELYKTIHPAFIFEPDDKQLITEGTDEVVFTYSNRNDQLVSFLNGMGHGGRPNPFFYYEAIKAMSYKKDIKKVLVIGFGNGSTLEAIKMMTPIPHVTLAELSPTVLENLRQIDTTRALLSDSHVTVICTDGRKLLYNSKEKFDAIFMDPVTTVTSFSNNIYSKEFFTMIKDHLDDKGVFMAWTDELHTIPRTLCMVYPYVTMHSATIYNSFAVCSKSPLVENEAYRLELLNKFPPAMVAEISKFKYDAAKGEIMDRQMVLNATEGYPINEDYRPKCEYFIGSKGVKKALIFYKHPLLD